jgi:hypothetical protein
MTNLTNTRTSYRLYFHEMPVGVSIYAYKFEHTADDMLFFADSDGDIVCCVGAERIERVMFFNLDTRVDEACWTSATKQTECLNCGQSSHQGLPCLQKHVEEKRTKDFAFLLKRQAEHSK